MTNDTTNSESHDTTDEGVNVLDSEPDEESKFANPDDVLVARGGDGEKINQTVTIHGLEDPILVEPLNYGDVQKYFGDGSQFDVEEEAIAKVVDRFILEPDFAEHADTWAGKVGKKPRGRVTGEYIEDWKPMMVRDVLLALFESSGIDASVAMQGTTAQVDVGNRS